MAQIASDDLVINYIDKLKLLLAMSNKIETLQMHHVHTSPRTKDFY